jgi:hypothetical protein
VREQRERLVEEIRTAQRAQDLLVGLERRLKERDRSDVRLNGVLRSSVSGCGVLQGEDGRVQSVVFWDLLV